MPMIDRAQTEPEQPQHRSLAAMLAFEFREEGIDHLKAFLAAIIEDGTTRRESLTEAACQLRALNVPIADEVLKAAAECPSRCDVDSFCPFLRKPYANDPQYNQLNVKQWLWGEERRAAKQLQRCRELLEQAGVDPGWLNGSARQ
jgi:hypothetical protein